MEYISQSIREIPDWPKKGILFQDITTMLLDPKARSTACTCVNVIALRPSIQYLSCIVQPYMLALQLATHRRQLNTYIPDGP